MASSGSRCAATGSSADAHGARTTFTRAEVAARASAGASVFIVDGDVIDFGGFAHPGGHAILRRHAGEDVSAVFRGTRAGEGRRYAHSDGARRMLRRLRVGTIETLESETRDEPPKPTEPKARRVRSVARSARDRRFRAPCASPDEADRAEADRADDGAPSSSVGSDDDETEETKKRVELRADSRRPLFEQVGDLGARGAYAAWVYEPESTRAFAGEDKDALGRSSASRARSPRFFQNATLEFFSKSPWYLVPLTWTPVALASMADGWGRLRTTRTSEGGFRDGDGRDALALAFYPALAAVAFAAGTVLWSAMEYACHRFVFHHVPRGRAGAQAHFLAHGCHHKAPTDTLRLTFPPAAAAPAIGLARAAFFAGAELAFGALGDARIQRALARAGERDGIAATLAHVFAAFLFAGCLLGYVAYDCMHFALHAADGATLRAVDRRLGTRLERKKAAHLRHHFVDHARAFGISSERWDRVMGTEHVGGA